jgi:hypothetical protein
LRRLLFVFSCALVACGPAVNGTWRGPPLLTLTGQLSLKEGLALERGVRLAIAWYPNLAGDVPVAPRSIVTEELEYTGIFPQRFSFPLYAAPAREALEVVTREDGTVGEAAVGQLFAYEDVDGDGRLTVDADGHSPDRILGSTAGAGPFDFFSNEQRDVVAWVKEADELGLASEGMKPGYNLLRVTSPVRPPRVMPLDTSIPLVLTGDPRLALIVCPEAYADPQAETACGVTVWSTPAVNGSISLREGALDVFVSVQNGARSVTVNGTALEPDSSGQIFTLSEPSANVLRVGVNSVVVDAPGFQPITLEAIVPTPFDFVTPVAGEALKAGEAVRVEWTQAVGATLYSPSLSAVQTGDSTLVEGLSATLRVPAEPGPAMFEVTAFDRLAFSRSTVNGMTMRSVEVQIVP